MSNRAAEYRQLVEDVVAGWDLLEDDERADLRDMIARIERNVLANMPAESEAAE